MITNIIDIEANNNSVAIILKDGSLYTCGQNTNGELGIGSNENVRLFTKAINVDNEEMTDIVDVVFTATAIMALKSDGTVWTAGANNVGQLGREVTEEKPGTKFERIALTGINNIVVEIEAGTDNFFSMRTQIGEVYSIGNNSNGQFGNNTTTNSEVPRQAHITNVDKIVAGSNFLVYLTTEGKVYVSKYSLYGTFGIGDEERRAEPLMIQNIEKAVDIGTSYGTVYIRTLDGNVYSVGTDTNGEASNTDSIGSTTVVAETYNIYGESLGSLKIILKQK